MTEKNSSSYAEAGVDIDEGDTFVRKIKQRIAIAWPGTEKEIGGFAGAVNVAPIVKREAFSTDGVGTKLILAATVEHFTGVGIDAVAMSVVDNYVAGMRPRYLLDYFATGKLKTQKHIAIVDSVIEACHMAGCKLIGGETAEMPGFFRHDWYIDLVTFSVANDEQPIKFSSIKPGQKVFALPSKGLASNGFSLVRQILGLTGTPSANRRKLLSKRIFGVPLYQVLLKPTPIWIRTIDEELRGGLKLSGMVHVTGGGLIDNPVRVLPGNVYMSIDRSTWKRPEVFNYLQEVGGISINDMDRTFNNGVMMLCILDEESHDPVSKQFMEVGRIEQTIDDAPSVKLYGRYSS